MDSQGAGDQAPTPVEQPNLLREEHLDVTVRQLRQIMADAGVPPATVFGARCYLLLVPAEEQQG